MAVVNKDYRIKNGLVVEGSNATVGGYDVLKKTADDQYIIDLIGGNNGFIQTGDDASLNTLELTSNADGINLKVGDDAWIGDVNLGNTINIIGVEDSNYGYISFGQNGSLIDNTAQKKNYIGSNSTDLTLGSSNDIIFLPQSGYAYLGAPLQDGSNRIATKADIAAGAINSISGTTDQITVSMDGEAATISLPSYIDVPNGEMHLKKTEYWLNGEQYGVIDANPYSGNFNIVATNKKLELETQNGYDIVLNSSDYTNISGNNFSTTVAENSFAGNLNVGQNDWDGGYNTAYFRVFNNNGDAEFVVDTDNDVVTFNRRGGTNAVTIQTNSQPYTQVNLNNGTWMQFNDAGDNSLTSAELYSDGNFYIDANNGLQVRALSQNLTLSSNDADVNVNAFSWINLNQDVKATGDIKVSDTLTVGGWNGNAGIVQVNDSGNVNKLYIDANNNEFTLNNYTRLFFNDDSSTQLASIKVNNDLQIEGQQGVTIKSWNNGINLWTDSGDIVLNADGSAYLWDNTNPANEIATHGYVDSVAQGLDVKPSVMAATLTNFNLASPPLAEAGYTLVDGIEIPEGKTVLLAGQTDHAQNGIYKVTFTDPFTPVLVRPDYATFDSVTGTGTLTEGSFVFVEFGTNAGHGYVALVNGVGNLPYASYEVTWTQFSETGSYITSVGDNLTVTNGSLLLGTDVIITSASQHLSNKTIDGTLAFGSANSHDSWIEGEYDGVGNLTVHGGNNLNLTTNAGDIILNADGQSYLWNNGDTNNQIATIGNVLNGNSNAEPSYKSIQYNWTKETSAYQWAATDAQVTAISYPTNYASAKLIVRLRNGNDSQVSEVLLTLNNANDVYITEYAIVSTNGSLGDITASVSGGNVNVLVTPTHNTGTDVVTHATLMAWGD